MILKSVEIHGFKSFADKTELLFKPGVTAIVGPNGCGKSNIVDAIRWVLGESNARSLRGEVMDDVIFSGSEDRKPLGMAEVGITIVNDDRLLPIEYSEVNIKRRLYRSGESEYLINKNNVRLKDIHELFADTGIGKTAYSFMEQGNIDVLLSNRPEERMIIFEEAAGITRYKMRMKQSYKKLEATGENLIRLDIIIHEVEKEYKYLEKQAEKARLYKKLRKEEIHHETLYNYERIRNLRKQVDKNNTVVLNMREKKAIWTDEIAKLDDSIKRNIEKVRSLEGEIGETRNDIYKKEAEIEAVTSKSSHIKDRVYEIQDEITKKNQLIRKIKKNNEDLGTRLEHLHIERNNIQDLVSSQEDKLNNYLSEIEYINKAIRRGTDQVAEYTKMIEETEEAVHNLREDLRDVIDRLLKEIDSIKTRFEGTEKRKNELLKTVNGSFVKIESALKHHGTRLNDLVYSVKESDAHTYIEKLSEEIKSIKEKLSGLKADIELVISIQNDLSAMIFGKESMHSRKEQIEHAIEKHLKNERDFKNEIIQLNDNLKKSGEKKENFGALVNNLRPDIARNKEKIKYCDESLNRLKLELERSGESLQDFEFDINSLGERRKQFESKISRLSVECEGLEKKKVSLAEKIKEYNSLIEKIINDIQKNESKASQKRNQLDDIVKSIEKVELNNAELTSKIDTLIESFKERYSVSLELFRPEKDFDLKSINEQREKIRRNLDALGQVNPIAIEEFIEVKKRYEYLTAQREDLAKAKDDINVIVAKTVKTSKDLFMETFEKINNNFTGIFRRLFNGGKTDLFLTNDSNIFNSGVEIMACPPGKNLKRRSLLSGGEKSLTAIALLFAVFMVKASPFCMLDEVDHDLDEENILRFIKLLKEFTDTTQFVIITHNRRTIEFADVIYGITNEEAGVAKVVSLDLVGHAVE